MKICSACGVSTTSSVYHDSKLVCSYCHARLKSGVSSFEEIQSNKNATAGMISAEEFSQQKGIAEETVIAMIKSGSCNGRIVGDKWYVDEPDAVNNHTAPSYPALRTISKIYKVLASVTGIATGVLALYGLMFVGFNMVMLVITGGVFSVITNLAIAEAILVFLQIEMNTRKSS